MNTSKTFFNDFFKSQQLWLHLRQGFRILMIISLAVLLWSEANAQTGDPDIDVRGGSPLISIANGDDTPSLDDGTNFGGTSVGESDAQTFFIYNTGNANLNLTGTPAVQFTGPHAADFSLSTIYNTTIVPDGNTEFDIVFTPSASGWRTATLVIPNNDPDENPYTFAIRGQSKAPEMSVEHSEHFGVIIADGDMTPSESDGTDIGSANVGDIKTVEFHIDNFGDNVMLYLTARPEVQISGANASDFTFTDITRNEIGVAMESYFHIQFNPSAPGVRRAIISIPNNDPDENPYDFAIQGTGLPVGTPEIEVQGGSPLAAISDAATTPEIANGTDWGEINVGSGAVEHTFSIQNTGAMDLNLTGSSSRVVVTGEGFSLVTDATTPVVANGSTTFTICFTPSALGVKTGTVSIANNDADENPYNFVISATVVDQVAPVIVPVPGFTTIRLATSCYQTFTVTQCVASVSDNCASLTLDDVVISRVTSDEEEDARGIRDGFTKKDIVIAADGKSVKLRRERNIFRNGRVYTIHFSVNDGNGNTGTATYLVTVPICPVRPAVDDGPLYSVNGALSKSIALEDEQLEGEFVETIPPEAFVLEQNYPNPFNPQTLITYSLPFDATVSLKVYDGLGREVRELVNTSQAAGVYQAIFDGQGLASGVYYYAIKAFDNTGKSFSQMKRMILTK